MFTRILIFNVYSTWKYSRYLKGTGKPQGKKKSSAIITITKYYHFHILVFVNYLVSGIDQQVYVLVVSFRVKKEGKYLK